MLLSHVLENQQMAALEKGLGRMAALLEEERLAVAEAEEAARHAPPEAEESDYDRERREAAAAYLRVREELSSPGEELEAAEQDMDASRVAEGRTFLERRTRVVLADRADYGDALLSQDAVAADLRRALRAAPEADGAAEIAAALDAQHALAFALTRALDRDADDDDAAWRDLRARADELEPAVLADCPRAPRSSRGSARSPTARKGRDAGRAALRSAVDAFAADFAVEDATAGASKRRAAPLRAALDVEPEDALSRVLRAAERREKGPPRDVDHPAVAAAAACLRLDELASSLDRRWGELRGSPEPGDYALVRAARDALAGAAAEPSDDDAVLAVRRACTAFAANCDVELALGARLLVPIRCDLSLLIVRHAVEAAKDFGYDASDAPLRADVVEAARASPLYEAPTCDETPPEPVSGRDAYAAHWAYKTWADIPEIQHPGEGCDASEIKAELFRGPTPMAPLDPPATLRDARADAERRVEAVEALVARFRVAIKAADRAALRTAVDDADAMGFGGDPVGDAATLLATGAVDDDGGVAYTGLRSGLTLPRADDICPNWGDPPVLTTEQEVDAARQLQMELDECDADKFEGFEEAGKHDFGEGFDDAREDEEKMMAEERKKYDSSGRRIRSWGAELPDDWRPQASSTTGRTTHPEDFKWSTTPFDGRDYCEPTEPVPEYDDETTVYEDIPVPSWKDLQWPGMDKWKAEQAIRDAKEAAWTKEDTERRVKLTVDLAEEISSDISNAHARATATTLNAHWMDGASWRGPYATKGSLVAREFIEDLEGGCPGTHPDFPNKAQSPTGPRSPFLEDIVAGTATLF
ncbi:tRNA-Phe hydroxylase [Aureococcus anophagefferens]|nr:tRNA-Phe hydroxylase [Aureococcus anophagefferens]